MSDTFDHEADAWDDCLFNEERYQDEDHPYALHGRSHRPVYSLQEYKRVTQLFGVKRASDLKIIAETPLAKLYAAGGKQAWIPVSQLKCADSFLGPTIPQWLFGRIHTRLLLTY